MLTMAVYSEHKNNCKDNGKSSENFLLSYQTDTEFKVLLQVCSCYSTKKLRRIELALNHKELKKIVFT